MKNHYEHGITYPICSMYGIFTNINPKNGPNVDKNIPYLHIMSVYNNLWTRFHASAAGSFECHATDHGWQQTLVVESSSLSHDCGAPQFDIGATGVGNLLDPLPRGGDRQSGTAVTSNGARAEKYSFSWRFKGIS